MWTPRLVALDIDGTLVDRENVIPAELHAAVVDVVRAGVPVVLCTGRAWHATRGIADVLGLPPGPHVTSNGAVRVSYPPLHLDEVITFDPRSVVEQVDRDHPRCLIAVEIIGEGYRVNRAFPDGELYGRIEVADLAKLAGSPATRVVVRDPDASDDEFIDMAERMGLTGVSYSIGYTAWLDIAPEGVDKAHALKHVCAALHVDAADVLAIGDGRNDVEMLQFAGRGVALGDAPDEVQQAADAVTGLFGQGGTVAELRRFFPPDALRPRSPDRPRGARGR